MISYGMCAGLRWDRKVGIYQTGGWSDLCLRERASDDPGGNLSPAINLMIYGLMF